MYDFIFMFYAHVVNICKTERKKELNFFLFCFFSKMSQNAG